MYYTRNNHFNRLRVVWMLLLLALSAPSRRGIIIRGVKAFGNAGQARRLSFLRSTPRCDGRFGGPVYSFHPLGFPLGTSTTGYWNHRGLDFSLSMAALVPRRLTHRLFASNANIDNNGDDENWTVPKSIHIPEDSLEMTFIRSSGAGGQNVNKVNSQVQIKVLVDGMGWIPYEVRQRLLQQESRRINKEGFLVLQVQEHRTQPQNRKAAVDKLRQMILQAWPRPKKRVVRKGISDKAKKQRREDKRRRSMVKESRRRVDF